MVAIGPVVHERIEELHYLRVVGSKLSVKHLNIVFISFVVLL